jgi:hypothetical protein
LRKFDNEIYVFCDSREFLGISFTPLWKDMEWYLAPRRLDPLFVRRWWIDYDSPMNDRLSTLNLRFTCGTADEARWRPAEAEADELMAHLRSARIRPRVDDASAYGPCARGHLLALRVNGLARRWPHRGPLIVLAPTDEAFVRAGFNRVPGDGLKAAQVRQMIEAHVTPMSTTESIADGESVTTLAGRVVRLVNTKSAERCGDNIVLPIDDLDNARVRSLGE